MPIKLLSPLHWKDYELIDAGDFQKLERFGSVVTIRPEPQAVWKPAMKMEEWEKNAHVKFIPKSSSTGTWKKFVNIPDHWQIKYHHLNLKFKLALTSFKHVGLFPEQAVNWDFIHGTVKNIKQKNPKVLNLFAYTGGASLAAKAAGADVVHLDSVKQVVTWANQNMEITGLNGIRWVVEDAMKFVKREIKRGNKYHGIILDPPAYGHGPSGESWKLEDMIEQMVSSVRKLLVPDEHFLILNTYSLSFSSLILDNLLIDECKKDSYESGEICASTISGIKLPLGVFARYCHGI